MGDDDDGDAEAVADVADEVEDRAGRLGVEGAGGLVAQEDGGLVRQGPGDADALLLAAGELGGVGGSAIRQAHELEHPGDPLVPLALLGSGQVQGVGDVLGGSALVEEVGVLEDHADGAPGLAQLVGAEGGQVLAGDAHLAVGGALEGGQAAHEGGLAGAGGADDAVDGAGRDVEGEPVQGVDLRAVAQAVDLVDVAQGDHGLVRVRGACRSCGLVRLASGCGIHAHSFLHRSWRKHLHR